MNHIPTFEEFVNEGFFNRSYLANDFKKGDKIEINSKEGMKSLIGKKGVVAFIDAKRGIVGVDFGVEFSSAEDLYTTWNLEGKLKTETGLQFVSQGVIGQYLDPRFSIKSLTKIN